MTQYATRADLAAMGGLPSHVLRNFDTATQDAKLKLASEAYIDSYLQATRHSVPLTAPGADVKLRVCQIAAWLIMSERGINPDNGDTSIETNFQNAMSWLNDVKRGTIVLVSQADQTPTVNEGAPSVYSSDTEDRGW